MSFMAGCDLYAFYYLIRSLISLYLAINLFYAALFSDPDDDKNKSKIIRVILLVLSIVVLYISWLDVNDKID